MPFLYIIGITCTNKNFKLAYCFLSGETEPDYYYLVKQLYLLYTRVNIKPKAFITNKEQALKNALRRYFPNVP